MKKHNFKIGNKVYTRKGCRVKGDPGLLTVIATGKYWMAYEAVVCEKLDGSKRLFLVKNLFHAAVNNKGGQPCQNEKL